jgi:hypothetical protein
VGPRASLDGCGKSRPHRDSIPGPSSPSKSLYRLSYPAPQFFKRGITKLQFEFQHGVSVLMQSVTFTGNHRVMDDHAVPVCDWLGQPRSLDRKKRIMGMASKITRLVPLGLLFVGGGHLKSLV